MVSAPAESARAGGTHRERFSGLILNLPNIAGFPYHQTLSLSTGKVEETRTRLRAAMISAGFRIAVSKIRIPSELGGGRVIGDAVVAERDLRRAPMSRRKRLASVVVFSAGIALGGLDALLFLNPLFAVPWVAGTGVGALFLWFAFGRAYASEVVVAIIGLDPKQPEPTSPEVPQPHRVTWLAAEVRSEVFPGSATGNRDAVEVSGNFPAVRALRAAVTSFSETGSRAELLA